MQSINLSSFILLAIGVITFVFTYWNRVSISRHLKHFTSRSSSSLADDKYFELRSKQEYIIAVAAIIVSLATFFGYQGLKTIKEDLNNEVQTEKPKLPV